MKTTPMILCVGLLVGIACDSKDNKKAPDSKPAAAAATPKADEPKADEPKAAAYSPEAASKAVGELDKCESQFSCDAIDTLIGFGDKASADLVAIVADTAKGKDLREIALHGLTEIKDPKVAMKLFEAGKVEKEFILRGSMFKAAAGGNDDATFKAMVEHYLAPESDDYRTELGIGIKKFDKAKVFAWASENYPEDKDKQTDVANLVMDSATEGDKAKIDELIGKTTHTMAKHRLASAMVGFGDVAKLDILVAGLGSEDQYDRSDAANMLAKVVDKVPADRKAEIVDLATKAKEQDRGGLTSRGFDKLIKELK